MKPLPSGRRARSSAIDLLCGAVLVASVAAIYAQTAGHAFVSYDDGAYVTENPHVRGGLSLANLRWAFGAFHAGNWHPLTWLSHQLDVQLFGLDPGPPHLVNAALHALNALLLFAFLRLTTDAPWASGLAALAFAVHPLRAESVAWVSERKDLLSACAFFLTLIAYARHARDPRPRTLALVALLLALGLMAKPMLVSVPVVLLALDRWPLGRPGLLRLREKAPLFALALASCLVTLAAQRAGGAVRSLEELGPGERLGTALLGAGAYLRQAVLPIGLAFFYPHPALVDPRGLAGHVLPMGAALLALALLSAGAWRFRRRAPALLSGWAWFVAMLLPVVGLVQVGTQLHADRYAYLPQVGLVLALVYGLPALVPRVPRGALFSLGLAGCAALGLAAHRQAGTWKDDRALCARALAVTSRNLVAHEHLALAHQRAREFEAARAQHLAALALAPGRADILSNLGAVSLELGQAAEARAWLEQALAAQSDFLQGRLNLGLLLEREHDPAGALVQYELAAREHGDSPEAWTRVGEARLALARAAEARAAFERALAIEPRAVGAWCGSGEALAELGRAHEALTAFARARALERGNERALLGEAWVRASSAEPGVRDPAAAFARLEELAGTPAEHSWRALRARAAALAASGRFAEAALAAAEASARAPRGEWERLAAERAVYTSGRALER